MAERKTRREYLATGSVITERLYHTDGSKSERFYATTKCNGGEPSGRELDDAFQAAQVLNAHDGLQDRLHDLDVRLITLLAAAQDVLPSLHPFNANRLAQAIEEARKLWR